MPLEAMVARTPVIVLSVGVAAQSVAPCVSGVVVMPAEPAGPTAVARSLRDIVDTGEWFTVRRPGFVANSVDLDTGGGRNDR